MLALALVFLGCSADVSGDPYSEPTATAYDRLLDHPEFDMMPDSTWVDMTVRVDRGDHVLQQTTRLSMDRGNLIMGADAYGNMTIDGLAISFKDVIAGAGTISPKGLWFTNVVASMEDPTACWDSYWRSDGDYCSATGELALKLHWSLVIDNRVYPLGTQNLGPMEVTVQAYQKDGDLFAEVDGTAKGVFWNWADIVEFSDLRVFTTAVQRPHLD